MRKILRRGLVFGAIALISGVMTPLFSPAAQAADPIAAPPTAAAPDPRLYLEDVTGERALAWVHGQNERSLARLTADPRFAAYQADALAVLTAKDRIPAPAIVHGQIENFWQDEHAVRGVWRTTTLDHYVAGAPEWRTLLDIDALAAKENANWVFKGANCSAVAPDRCLISLSNGGKDAVTAREFDKKTGAFIAGGFVLPEAKQGVAWQDRDHLLVATDWGAAESGPSLTESGYPFIVKRLKRGQGLEQAQEVFRGAPSDVSAGAQALTGPHGAQRIVYVRSDTFFTARHFLAREHAAPLAIPVPAKASLIGLFAGQVLVRVNEDWPLTQGVVPAGSLASFDLAAFERTGAIAAAAILYAPKPRESLYSVAISENAVIITTLENVVGAAYRVTFAGGEWTRTKLALPDKSTIAIASADERDDHVFFSVTGFLTPASLWLASGSDGAPHLVRTSPARFNAEALTVEQYEAVSRDGTKVPYFVVRRKDLAFDGSAPTLLYGYGGFEISLTPSYSGSLGKLWLEHGGVYVLANIRGGGEFGPAWHEAGLKTRRQVVYDDFIAIGEDLVKRRITRPEKLGIMGGSNGGLLMGVMFTQRPDLWKAVVVQVPLLDMLRYHLLLAGASWIGEYGDPRVPEERAWLEKLSPYNNLRADVTYPEPFFTTSTKDDRVHPGHARKMAALLESRGLPFLYYENTDGGHAAAANLNETARRQALEFVYLAQKLMD